MTDFLDVLTIVLPVFLVIGLGFCLRRWGFLNAAFLTQTNRLVFYVCLPLLLFHKIGAADFAANFNGRLVLGSVLSLAFGFGLSYGYAALRKYPPAIRGTFSQGAFRGNLAYVGLAIVFNAYGTQGLTRAGILMGFLVPALNFFAVAALLLPHRAAQEGHSPLFWVRQVALNPLLIASFAGIAWSSTGQHLPLILDRAFDIATGMTLPLALVAIGASFSFTKLRGDLVRAGLASTCKVVVMPIAAALILAVLGVGGEDLAIGVLLAATPTATATYIMAEQMGGDAELAGSIVMLSTLLSAATYTAALLALRGLALG